MLHVAYTYDRRWSGIYKHNNNNNNTYTVALLLSDCRTVKIYRTYVPVGV